MPHNPHAPLDAAAGPAPRFALPGHRVIALAGRDALAFAQAQCMNDVEAVPIGRWQWNGWLTPKGRVIALFALLRIAPEELWLLVPDADAAMLATQLQRFVLRRKLTVVLREDLLASGAFAAPAQAVGASFAGDTEGGLELDLGGSGLPRTLHLSSSPGVLDADAGMRWAASDLRLGFPRLSPAQAEQWTPQMLSLDRLQAFSVKKGCYPGQEIVARTHFLGQAKRGLALFECGSAIEPGTDLMVGTTAMGQVVSSARDGDTWVALGVLPVERPEAPVSAGGMALREQALLPGLAR